MVVDSQRLQSLTAEIQRVAPCYGVGDITEIPTSNYPPEWGQFPISVIERPDGVTLRIDYDPSATAGQVSDGDKLATGWDLRPHRLRLLYDIHKDLDKLTSTQKQAISQNLTAGSPPLWTTDRGVNSGAILSVWISAQVSVMTPPDAALCKQAMATMYTQDNPRYLVNPAFDPSINVPGDEPIPPA